MKKFYINYYRNFGNTFNLCYCNTEEEERAAVSAGFERITRKEAERKCAEEKNARKFDPAFSGYGDTEIVPWSYLSQSRKADDLILPEDVGLRLNGYIWEK